MTPTTRCPACLTSFRVTQSQLEKASGWVRCGRCDEIFDGRAHLIPPDQDPTSPAPPSPTPRWEEPTPDPLDAPQPERAAPAPGGLQAERWRDPILEPESADPMLDTSPAGKAVSWDPSPEEFPDWANGEPGDPFPLSSMTVTELMDDNTDTRFEDFWTDVASAPTPPDHDLAADDPADWITDREQTAAPVAHELTPPRATPEAPPADAPEESYLTLEPDDLPAEPDPLIGAAAARVEPGAETDPPPSFVTSARRRAFWISRPVRLALSLLSLILILGLAAQVAVHQRDLIAARHPQFQPLLSSLCQPLGCTIQPYRELGALAITSSRLNRQDDGSFEFSLSLRNRATIPVATPALELTLTDLSNQVVVRRSVSPDELGAPEALESGGEFNGLRRLFVSAPASADDIVNYRLALFYPS